MTKIIFYTFLAGASIVLLLVFRAQVFAGYDYFFEGPYRWVPDKELDRMIEDSQTRLAVVQSKIDAMPKGRADHSVRMDMVKQAKPLINDRERMLEERKRRPERRRYYFMAAAAVSTLVFLSLLKRAWLGRDPEFRRREKTRKGLKKELAAIQDKKSRPVREDDGEDIKRTLS